MVLLHAVVIGGHGGGKNKLQIMTLKVLPIILLTIILTNANAQLALSLKAGVQANDLVVRNTGARYSSGYQSGYSLHAGVFTMFEVGRRVNLIPEVQLIHKTSRVDGGGTPTTRLTYLEVPFLVSYEATHWLSAEAGPSLGLKVTDNTPTKYFNAIDAGANLGVRVKLDDTWSLLARYYYGLSTVDKLYWQGPGAGDLMRLYDQNFQLSVTYALE